MAEVNAKGTVVEERKKRATAQQAVSALHSQVEEMKQVHLQIFMSNWKNNGLALVTSTYPAKTGDIGHHTCKTMADALNNQNNQFLLAVSEQLTEVPEEHLKAKKDGAYLVALVKVGMKKRCEDFLLEWERDGPKCIDLPLKSRLATTQEAADKHLAPLIAESVNGSRVV